MSARIRHHFRSNVIGYIALFCFAMAATASATHPGGANTISSGDIINGEVRNGDLAADSVASGKIQDQQVKNADLSIGASSSNTIADGGIQGIDVANDTLSGADLAEASLRIPENSINPPGGEPASTACDQISEVGSFSVSPDFTEIGEPTPAKLWVCVRLSGISGDGSEWQSVTLG